MNNSSIFMNSKVDDLIRSMGSYLLCTDPFSIDMNERELIFNIYKSSLYRGK